MLVYSSEDREYVAQCRRLGMGDRYTEKYLKYRLSKTQQKRRRGRTAFKDSNKTKVYRAEWAFEAIHGTGKDFKNIKQCQKYVDRIVMSKLWGELTNHRRITVTQTKATRILGRAYGSRIDLAKNGFNQYVVLHELAHCAGHMHHDVSFRQTLVKLVSRFWGREQAAELKKQFKAKGLKMTRKLAIKEPDVWFAGVKRLEAARNAK